MKYLILIFMFVFIACHQENINSEPQVLVKDSIYKKSSEDTPIIKKGQSFAYCWFDTEPIDECYQKLVLTLENGYYYERVYEDDRMRHIVDVEDLEKMKKELIQEVEMLQGIKLVVIVPRIYNKQGIPVLAK